MGSSCSEVALSSTKFCSATGQVRFVAGHTEAYVATTRIVVNDLPCRPLSVDRFRDGSCYALRSPRLRQTNVYLKVTELDQVFVKVPNEEARDYHRTLLFKGLPGPYAIREPEGLELPERFSEALDQLPDFRTVLSDHQEYGISLDDETVNAIIHYLVVHRLHVDKLKHLGCIAIPEARFVVAKVIQRKFSLLKLGFVESAEITPAIIQQKVRGTSLWEIFDPITGSMHAEWYAHRRTISDLLRPLARSPESKYYDWNLQNFIFDDKTQILHYVDSKPTIFARKYENDRNLEGIKRCVLTPG
jgi:hypothetical protein